MVSTTPPAKSRQLHAKGEVWSEEGFSHLAVVWTENFQIYIAQYPGRGKAFDDNLNALNELEGTLIPKEYVYPAWRENITEVQTQSSLDIYIKTPHCLAGHSDLDLINAEIDIMEMLSKIQHPNICKYYGCLQDGGYITGICLQKYKCTLQDIIEGKVPVDQRPPFDADLVFSGIKAGLDFLHSLGLVHDDINPRNVMLDDDGHAIIIDFDSCAYIGAKSRGGTPGWSTRPTTAQLENDEHGLSLITKYIRGEYDGQDLDAFGM